MHVSNMSAFTPWSKMVNILWSIEARQRISIYDIFFFTNFIYVWEMKYWSIIPFLVSSFLRPFSDAIDTKRWGGKEGGGAEFSESVLQYSGDDSEHVWSANKMCSLNWLNEILPVFPAPNCSKMSDMFPSRPSCFLTSSRSDLNGEKVKS